MVGGTDRRNLEQKAREMKARYFVTPHTARPGTWKLEIPASVSGSRIKRFFRTEAEAWAAGPALLEALQKTGTEGVKDKEQAGLSMRSAIRDYIATKAKSSEEHKSKIERVCGKLLEEFDGPVANVTPLKAGKWFDSVEGSPTTRAGWHRYASGFSHGALIWSLSTEIRCGGYERQRRRRSGRSSQPGKWRRFWPRR